MISRTTSKFWHMFDALPHDVQDNARRAYSIWRENPSHPSLQFKRVSRAEPIYSVRIGLAHRALGLLEADTVTWIWIGSHDEYERQLR